MADARMARQAVGGLSASVPVDHRDELAVARKAGVLGDVAVERDDPDGLREALGGEGVAVPETVQCLDRIFGGDVVVGNVTIAAGGDGFVAAAVPAVVVFAHDVAVGAGSGVAGQVG